MKRTYTFEEVSEISGFTVQELKEACRQYGLLDETGNITLKARDNYILTDNISIQIELN